VVSYRLDYSNTCVGHIQSHQASHSGIRSRVYVPRSFNPVRMRELHNEEATVEWMLTSGLSQKQKEAKVLAVLEGDASLRRKKIIMQPSGKELPRLSGALRAFGGLTSEVSYDPVSVDETLVRKKQKRKNTSSSTEKNWDKVFERSQHCVASKTRRR